MQLMPKSNLLASEVLRSPQNVRFRAIQEESDLKGVL
jgi:hypothetical protein